MGGKLLDFAPRGEADFEIIGDPLSRSVGPQGGSEHAECLFGKVNRFANLGDLVRILDLARNVLRSATS